MMRKQQPTDQKIKVIQRKDLEFNKLYAFTLSFVELNKHAKRYSVWECFNIYMQCISKIEAPVKLVPEYTTQTMRLHFHGYIKFNNHLEVMQTYAYLNELNNICHIATYEIDKIDDSEKWKQYIYKELDYTRAYLKHHTGEIFNIIDLLHITNQSYKKLTKNPNITQGKLTIDREHNKLCFTPINCSNNKLFFKVIEESDDSYLSP